MWGGADLGACFSWPRIRQAAQSSTDDDVEDLLRATALYRTLSLLRSRAVNIDHLLRPSEVYLAEVSADMDALRTRFGGLANADDLIEQCMQESRQVQAWVDDSSVRFEELYDEVDRVVCQDEDAGV